MLLLLLLFVFFFFLWVGGCVWVMFKVGVDGLVKWKGGKYGQPSI